MTTRTTPDHPINLDDYRTLAWERLDRVAWDYFEGGSEDEVTLRANSAAFQAIRIRPRVLVDVRECRTATTVLGAPVSMPILVAPMGCQRLAHPEGECATARAAARAGTVYVASTMATASLEETAAADGPRWFQLYIYADRAVTEALIQRAEAAGYQALVLTVDLPRMGRRERDIRNGFGLPPHLGFANFAPDSRGHAGNHSGEASALMRHTSASFDAGLTWRDIEWLRAQTRLPILLKGILSPEDARLGAEAGVDGVIVSNHGGRQLDGVPPSIEALPAVVDAVAGRCPVLLDGGVRRGTDALKALALGAKAVLVGRPVLWGLASRGEAGVLHILELLRAELELAMALAGCPSLDQIDRSRIG
ncbi:MAG TPA: alpha-hydroxy acid oxidase [Roseiflexaceae bacterium]|nr:alpha-hydroxy acid oxidase [Roseiflexaceae bacterium]